MKILIFTDKSNFNGGVEKTSKKIASILQNNNFSVLYVSLGNKDNVAGDFVSIRSCSFFLHKLIYRFLRNFNFERKLRKHLRCFEPDIVYIFNDNLLTSSIYHVFKKYRIIKAINDYHIICPFSSAVQSDYSNCNKLISCSGTCNCLVDNSFLYRLHQKTFYAYKQRLYQKRVKVFTVSSPTLLQYLKTSTPFNNVYFIPNPLTEVSPENSLSFPIYDFCFIGHLDINKGFPLVLEFLNRNLSSLNRILIIGDGPLRPKLEEIMITQIYSSKIKYVPSVPNISDYIQKSKFVIVPSIMNDNEPGVLKIALLNNKFVLGSNRGGIPWILNSVGIKLSFDPLNYYDFEQKLMMLHLENCNIDFSNNQYWKKIHNMFSDSKFLQEFNQMIEKCA